MFRGVTRLFCALFLVSQVALAAETDTRLPEPPVQPSAELPPGAERQSAEEAVSRLPAIPPDFNTVDRNSIRFVFPAHAGKLIQPLLDSAASVRAELSERLGQVVLNRVEVRIARTAKEMASFAPVGSPFPKYASGVAYPELSYVLLTLEPLHPGAEHNLGQVFRHELAHIALHDAVRGARVPRWFDEGFAVLASGEASWVRLRSLWTATLADTLLSLGELERGFPEEENQASIAYAQAADLVRYLVRQQEAHRFRKLIEELKSRKSLERAVVDAYGIDLTSLDLEWREEIGKRYTFWPVLFSGSFVWAGALGLFIWGWRHRRKRARATLERWEREEAAEDALKRAPEPAARRGPGRIQIVLTRSPGAAREPRRTPLPPEADVPKVQHDGQWHTLH